MNQDSVNKSVLVLMVIAISAAVLLDDLSIFDGHLSCRAVQRNGAPGIPSIEDHVQGAPAPGFGDHAIVDDRDRVNPTVSVDRTYRRTGD